MGSGSRKNKERTRRGQTMTHRLITLVYEKNHYLEKFYSVNEKELAQFIVGNFENLEGFYQTREQIMEMIRYVDLQIDKSHNEILHSGRDLSDEIKRELKRAMKIKDEYVDRILHQDLDVLSCIDRAKNEIIRELQSVKRNKKAVSGYRMPDFAKSLDEEA
jgi:hypothetical protein